MEAGEIQRETILKMKMNMAEIHQLPLSVSPEIILLSLRLFLRDWFNIAADEKF